MRRTRTRPSENNITNKHLRRRRAASRPYDHSSPYAYAVTILIQSKYVAIQKTIARNSTGRNATFGFPVTPQPRPQRFIHVRTKTTCKQHGTVPARGLIPTTSKRRPHHHTISLPLSTRDPDASLPSNSEHACFYRGAKHVPCTSRLTRPPASSPCALCVPLRGTSFTTPTHVFPSTLESKVYIRTECLSQRDHPSSIRSQAPPTCIPTSLFRRSRLHPRPRYATAWPNLADTQPRIPYPRPFTTAQVYTDFATAMCPHQRPLSTVRHSAVRSAL